MKPRNVRRVRRPTIDSQPQEPNRPLALSRKDRHRQGGGPRYVVAGLIALAVSAALWFGGRITTINVENSTDPEKIEQLVNEQLDQRFWYRNVLTLPKSTIEEAVTEANPEVIDSVKITKTWLSRAINVIVEERRAVMKWQIASGTYGVDQKGIISSLDGMGQDSMPLIIDSTNLDVKPGQAVVPPRFVDFVLDMQQQLPTATKLTFKRGRLIETSNELLVDTNQNYYLRVDTTRPAAEQIAVLKRLLSKSLVQPAHYVDLRIPYKIYFR